METQPKTTLNPMVALVLGLLLLLPAAYVTVTTFVTPAALTFTTSQTDSNLLRPASFIGMENYSRMAQDPRLGTALSYTARLMLNRIAIAGVIPVIVGILMGIQGRIGRTVNRLIMSILIVVVSPVALTALWSVYWGRMWGMQPSPLWPLPDSQMLSSPDGAQNSILMLDGAITGVIALVVGCTAFMAALRSRRAGKWPMQSLVGVWLIGLLLAAGSGVLSFTLPYILTNGGPGFSTSTFMLYHFQNSFQAFRFGYGSALSVLLIVGGMIVGVIVWLILVAFRLRIAYSPASEVPRWGNFLLIPSLPLALIIGYPLLSLFLWGNGQVESNGGSGALLEGIDWMQALNNSLAPLTTIWLIQLPIAYLAGLALGFLRPLGRIGSNALFLLFLLFLFIPTEALHNAWYMQARELGILDTLAATTRPWLIGAAALIIFKLFFDSAYNQFNTAPRGDQTSGSIFLRKVFLPSLPIVLLVGVALSFISLQAFLWPLLVVNSKEFYPLTVQLAILRNDFSANNLQFVGLAETLIRGPGLIFGVAFILLQIFVLDRLAILGGKPVTEAITDGNTGAI